MSTISPNVIDIPLVREARYYRKWDEEYLLCDLCAHYCKISEGEKGICHVRQNVQGKLYTFVYGKVVACQTAKVEKIPLFHYRPGSQSLTIATPGCNFHCSYCNNYDISVLFQETGEPVDWGCPMSPEEVVALACMTDCSSVAFSYTEPTIFYEYAHEIAEQASDAGFRILFGTNGYITEEPLKEIASCLDVANVDLKTFSDKTHRRVMGAKLQPVLDCLTQMKALGIWVEVTTPVIPTLNDSEKELRDIATFVRELGAEVPWHVVRFYPDFRLNHLPVTPAASLRRAREIGQEAGLRYVYTNISAGGEGEHTYCRLCRETLIERFGYEVRKNRLVEGCCPVCGTPVDGVDMDPAKAKQITYCAQRPGAQFVT
ncbi:MAG: AmmeMemoRadiSam system radical SAM enzyme [Armatimonadetes bacterium]|nr:AmmeMemoRadiSam system radical SAM enzyme [Armatimonadota bacterium]